MFPLVTITKSTCSKLFSIFNINNEFLYTLHVFIEILQKFVHFQNRENDKI